MNSFVGWSSTIGCNQSHWCHQLHSMNQWWKGWCDITKIMLKLHFNITKLFSINGDLESPYFVQFFISHFCNLHNLGEKMKSYYINFRVLGYGMGEEQRACNTHRFSVESLHSIRREAYLLCNCFHKSKHFHTFIRHCVWRDKQKIYGTKMKEKFFGKIKK